MAGLFTNLFFGILRVSLLIALYQGETSVNGMDVGGAITYVALSQAMIAYLTILETPKWKNQFDDPLRAILSAGAFYPALAGTGFGTFTGKFRGSRLVLYWFILTVLFTILSTRNREVVFVFRQPDFFLAAELFWHAG